MASGGSKPATPDRVGVLSEAIRLGLPQSASWQRFINFPTSVSAFTGRKVPADSLVLPTLNQLLNHFDGLTSLPVCGKTEQAFQ